MRFWAMRLSTISVSRPRRYSVRRDPAPHASRDACQWGRTTGFGHVDEVVVAAKSIINQMAIKWVRDVFRGVWVEPGVFEIGVAGQVEAGAPHAGCGPGESLGFPVPAVEVVNELRRIFALPHKRHGRAVNEGVAALVSLFEEVHSVIVP